MVPTGCILSVIQVFRGVPYTCVCACLHMGMRASARTRVCVFARAHVCTCVGKGASSSLREHPGSISGPAPGGWNEQHVITPWTSFWPAFKTLSFLSGPEIRKGKETRGALSQARGRRRIQEGRQYSSYFQIPPDLLLFLSEVSQSKVGS